MHAGIAGSGLIGRLLALRLLKCGWQVSLFDRDQAAGHQSCGYAAAGMLCGASELLRAELIIFEWGRQSQALWPSILNRLDQPVNLQYTGSILVSSEQDRSELDYFVRRLGKKLSLDKSVMQMLDKTALLKLEPELANFNRAVYLLDEGFIDARAFYASTHKTLKTKVNQWYENEAVIQLAHDAIISQQGTYHFDRVFDCRGLGAQEEVTDLRGVRGEALLVHAPAVNITRPVRFLHPRYSLYIVPRMEHHYFIGASEIESDDMSPISARTTLELLSAACSVHRGFIEARIMETCVNCRPTLPDHVPKVWQQEGVTRINGLFRHGYLVGPALVEQVVEMVSGM